MLSRAALLSANAVKSNVGVVGAGLVQAQSLHTSGRRHLPVAPLPEKGGKVRHGVIPEEFFQMLYPKTGVTGPYMLGTGLLVYLLSKEIYVINNETLSGLTMIGVIIYGIKKFGPSVAAFADKLNEEKIARAQEVKDSSVNAMTQAIEDEKKEQWRVKDSSVNAMTQAIEDEKKEQWRVEGRSLLFDAKRNNVAMILESNYRERLHMVTNEVKKRLDYQVALQHMQKRMQQEHMINWVEKSVVGSLTPEQEKASITKCISDLKALAKARAVAA